MNKTGLWDPVKEGNAEGYRQMGEWARFPNQDRHKPMDTVMDNTDQDQSKWRKGSAGM